MSLTVNSFGAGVRLVINAAVDLSGAVLTLEIVKPNGVVLTRTAPDVALGAYTLVIDSATLYANQYVEYALQSGDLDEAGVYAVRLIPAWSSPQKTIPTPTKTFTVSR